jgi:hypothetical protein
MNKTLWKGSLTYEIPTKHWSKGSEEEKSQYQIKNVVGFGLLNERG